MQFPWERGKLSPLDHMMSLLLASGIVWFAWFFGERLDAEEERDNRRWLFAWIVKGCVIPSLVWLFMMTGLFPGVPRLVPPITLTFSGGIRAVWDILLAMGSGVLLIGTFWLAFTLVAYVERLAPRAAYRWELPVFGGLWAILASPFAYFIFRQIGWPGTGAALCFWLIPLVIQWSNYPPPRVEKPSYARAIAMMKRGKYADAEWAVIQELEKCADDFDGWMMLAEMYAVRFHDLPSAVQTISDLCSQPNVSPSQAAIALHRLADWQLQLAEDPGAARLVLEQIGRQYPGTHLAHMAALRIQQLPASPEALREQRLVKKIHLPAGQETFEEALAPQRPELGKEEAVALANEHSARLARNPNDTGTREAFARLLAENLGQAKLALEQLELLLAMPTPADSQKVAWLLLEAAWQLKYLEDRDTAKNLLSRLVNEYPKTPQAFSAQRKLSRLEVEDRYRRLQTGRICLPTLVGDGG